jgi:DNA-binding GntR family transcriptional regulator
VLEDEIVSGTIAPGVVLRQEQLSDRFGVSRTPIREALRKLAALGLVSFEPNRGVRVRTITREELREAFLVRAELESLATEVAATKMTDDALAELDAAQKRFHRLTEEMRSREPGRDRRELTADWVRANHAFHDVIYLVADLPLVEQLAKSARRTFSGPAVWAPGDETIDALYDRNDRQHQAIAEALRAGSASGARALAREHVLDSFHLLDVILSHVAAPQPRRRRRQPRATGAS